MYFYQIDRNILWIQIYKDNDSERERNNDMAKVFFFLNETSRVNALKAFGNSVSFQDNT